MGPLGPRPLPTQKNIGLVIVLRRPNKAAVVANRQTNRQIDRQTGRQTDRQTEMGRQVGRQAARQAGRQGGRQASKHTNRNKDRNSSSRPWRLIQRCGHVATGGRLIPFATW